jgi:hypothetical protein
VEEGYSHAHEVLTMAPEPGVIADFSLRAIPQPHNPNAPLMLVNSKLAAAKTAG